MRFGTWFWGLGMDSTDLRARRQAGASYELPEELAALANVKQHINVYTNFNAFRDSAPNFCHYTGWIILRTGSAPIGPEDRPGETIDVTIARAIGRTTRFQTLTATANGDVRNSFSYENANSTNAAGGLAARLLHPALRARPTRTRTPQLHAEPAHHGAQERAVRRARPDQAAVHAWSAPRTVPGSSSTSRTCATSSGSSTMQLTKPEPIASCHPVTAPTEDPKPSVEATVVAQRHRMMTDLMVMAVACDQTRVFNMAYSAAFASTTKAGYEKPHHTCTHEEPIDQAIGYQPNASWFLRRSMESWAYFVEAFGKIKEGDGTLLDNMLIYASTDTAWARIHSLDGIPLFTAGRAGGRIKTGLHIDGASGPGARVGYTALKTFGVDASSWGTKSNSTSKEISEILA